MAVAITAIVTAAPSLLRASRSYHHHLHSNSLPPSWWCHDSTVSIAAKELTPFGSQSFSHPRSSTSSHGRGRTRLLSGTVATAQVSNVRTLREGWKERADSLFQNDSRPIILFDGLCNLCNGGVNFILDNDLEGKLRLAALQSEAGKALLQRSGRAPNDISSIVLVERDGSYIKSEAILRIAKYLGLPYPVLAASLDLFPLFFRDTVYDAVANNRYSIFGRTASCRMSDGRFEDRFIEF